MVGGVESGGSWTVIDCAWTVSAFPAPSHDRYCTVADAVIGNGRVYVGLASVGVVPSVV